MFERIYRPRLHISKTSIVGAAGLCDSCGNITVCIDLPFWFIPMVLFHELCHWIDNTIGVIIANAKEGETWNPSFSTKFIMFLEDIGELWIIGLPKKYRERCRVNLDTLASYAERFI